MAGLGEIPGLVHVHSAGMCPVTGQPFLVMDALLLATEEIRRICVERLGLTPAAANRIADADELSLPRPLTLQDILGDERVGTARQLPERAVLALARDIAAALARLHGRTPPVIHRDIKPANLLFAPDGRIRLGDFGIARELAPERLGFTHTGFQLGTRRYAAPEQQGGRPPTPAVDWYALGVVLFRALYSSFPEWGEAFPTHSGLRPTSPLWKPLLRDLLAKDPARRLANAAAFSRRLDTIERSLSSPPRRRRGVGVLLGGLGVLGALGILGFLGYLGSLDNSSPVSDSAETPALSDSRTSDGQRAREAEAESLQPPETVTENRIEAATPANGNERDSAAEGSNSVSSQDVYTGAKWPKTEPATPFQKSIAKRKREDEEAILAAIMQGRRVPPKHSIDWYNTQAYRASGELLLQHRSGQPITDADLEKAHILREEWEAWRESIDRISYAGDAPSP